MMRSMRLGAVVACALALLLATDLHPARAGTVSGTVSLDTSALAGPFELAFIFTDGSGIGDGNNSVTLGDFLFGAGGSAGSVDALLSTGGESGDLISGVSLVDTSFLNLFASSFMPGSLLSFNFGLTTNVDAGGTPDQLSVALLRPDGSVVSTDDPSGANSLLTVDLGARPTFSAFASDLTPAAIVTESAAVPEPPSLLLLALGLLGLQWSARTRPRAERSPSRSGPCANLDPP